MLIKKLEQQIELFAVIYFSYKCLTSMTAITHNLLMLDTKIIYLASRYSVLQVICHRFK